MRLSGPQKSGDSNGRGVLYSYHRRAENATKGTRAVRRPAGLADDSPSRIPDSAKIVVLKYPKTSN